jgi:hypothetical protein
MSPRRTKVLAAADPQPDDLRRALDKINPPDVCTESTQGQHSMASPRAISALARSRYPVQ